MQTILNYTQVRYMPKSRAMQNIIYEPSLFALFTTGLFTEVYRLQLYV